MKKKYFSPITKVNSNTTAMAAPLAFFSAATAAAAVVGTAVGAAAAAKVMGDDRFLQYRTIPNKQIHGLIV